MGSHEMCADFGFRWVVAMEPGGGKGDGIDATLCRAGLCLNFYVGDRGVRVVGTKGCTDLFVCAVCIRGGRVGHVYVPWGQCGHTDPVVRGDVNDMGSWYRGLCAVCGGYGGGVRVACVRELSVDEGGYVGDCFVMRHGCIGYVLGYVREAG
jgi:hypothetical protein